MKKLILLALLTLILTLSIGQFAFAQSCETKVNELAKENEKVLEAESIIYERGCIVAIRTEKFTSKSEYDSFVKELTEKIKSECDVDHVIVTRNPKIMVEIKALADKSESEREEAIRSLLENMLMKHRPNKGVELPKKIEAEQ